MVTPACLSLDVSSNARGRRGADVRAFPHARSGERKENIEALENCGD